MKTIEEIGKWAVIIGAAGFVGEFFVPGLKKYAGQIKMLIMGGAVAFIVGYFL